MKPISECKTVAELLEAPERWTQGVVARTQAGEPAYVFQDEACSFCLIGAILQVSKEDTTEIIVHRIHAAINKGRDAEFPISISKWNDAPERTHAEVLQLAKELGI